MPKSMRHVGLDVHAETIAVAVAEADGSVRELGTIRHRPEAVRKLIAKLGDSSWLRICYEAGRTGYPLYWQLTALGVHCGRLALAAEPYNKPDPVNVGSAMEISIRDLTLTIARHVGFKSEIKCDVSKPNGRQGPRLDVSRAERKFGFRAQLGFEEGLRRTIEWYPFRRTGHEE